jgi:hypothetical protein
MKRSSIVMTALLILLAAGGAGAEQQAASAGETPQSLYLQAGKAERQAQQGKAKELYEALIDRYPTSELAVKANDRLLELMKGSTAAEPGKQGAAPAAPAAPADPKAKARELLALSKKATDIQEKEWRRHSYAFFNRHDHRFNRAELRDQEVLWDKAAEEKVKKELGMGTEEIKSKLEEACKEAGITGPCDEKALK